MESFGVVSMDIFYYALVFLLFPAALLVMSAIWSGSLQDRVKIKTKELQEANEKLENYAATLEQKVEERTGMLNETLGKVEEANNNIMASIRYAKRIQESLLPNMDKIRKHLPDSFFLWMPKDLVGGDIFYADVFENSMIISVMDCTGHGVPGAFMTMIASSSVKRIIEDKGCRNPAEILKQLNFIVKTMLKQDTGDAVSDDGLDAAVCFVQMDSSAGTVLTFAGAKLPLYYIQDGQAHIIKGDKQSIGYKKADLDFDFTSHTISLEPGMSFYLATDGFADQKGGEKGFVFAQKRFKTLLQEVSNRPFDEQKKELIRAFDEYRGNYERQDDMTLLGFRL